LTYYERFKYSTINTTLPAYTPSTLASTRQLKIFNIWRLNLDFICLDHYYSPSSKSVLLHLLPNELAI